MSHAIKHRKNAKDEFYTPEAVAKMHIGLIPTAGKDDFWFDPFYGKGAYYNNFPTTFKNWSEIALGSDFFDCTLKPTIICSNPPYSILDEVFQKSVELAPRVISYLLLHGAMTPKRMEFFRENGYGLVSIYTTKVFQWYGMSEAYTFVKGADWNHCRIVFDRIVHRV